MRVVGPQVTLSEFIIKLHTNQEANQTYLSKINVRFHIIYCLNV